MTLNNIFFQTDSYYSHALCTPDGYYRKYYCSYPAGTPIHDHEPAEVVAQLDRVGELELDFSNFSSASISCLICKSISSFKISFQKIKYFKLCEEKCFLSNFNFASGSLLYLYDLFRGFELQRFDGPAGGSSLSEPTHRDDITEAATDYETDSGSDSEADPDHFCSVPRNARGVDMKLVSISSR